MIKVTMLLGIPILYMSIFFLDLSHSDTRLSVMLNGFELHVYNRCKMYSNLEKVFNLDPSIIPWDELSVSEYKMKKFFIISYCPSYCKILFL